MDDDFKVLVTFSNELLNVFRSNILPLQKVIDYCSSENVKFEGHYTIYIPKASGELKRSDSDVEMYNGKILMEARRGKMEISEKGLTTFKTEKVPEESFFTEIYFSDNLWGSVEELELFMNKKICLITPRPFYFANKIVKNN